MLSAGKVDEFSAKSSVPICAAALAVAGTRRAGDLLAALDRHLGHALARRGLHLAVGLRAGARGLGAARRDIGAGVARIRGPARLLAGVARVGAVGEQALFDDDTLVGRRHCRALGHVGEVRIARVVGLLGRRLGIGPGVGALSGWTTFSPLSDENHDEQPPRASAPARAKAAARHDPRYARLPIRRFDIILNARV